MTHGRILAVHDISCVGRCSLTVALPIISSVGLECSVLPTAVLSTHTGGFTGFTYRDLTEDIVPIQKHWQTLGLHFSGFYTGFLGSFQQIDLVKGLIADLSESGTTVYVDPVMADAGKLYSVFDDTFPKGMRKLCEKADVLMPNLTELCFMLDLEYAEGPYTWDYIENIFKESEVFGLKKLVITGVSFEEGKVGAVYKDYETGGSGQIMRDRIDGYFHGTGDVFGSALVGSLESGISLRDSVRIAVDFTVGSIKRTVKSGADVRYGVDFEEGLAKLQRQVSVISKGLTFELASDDKVISRIAGMAANIWPEAYDFLSQDLIEYMIENYQSREAIAKYIDEGYLYYAIQYDGEDIGYIGMAPEEKRMFVSKIYLIKHYRGLGLLDTILKFIISISKGNGLSSMYLTVNRENRSAIAAYQNSGFIIVDKVDKPIGKGFEMNDYIMEMRF
ncbi:MAG: pyridoxamine kinase [Thermoplasmata archaeon]|nr:pyridoxamine kinase [Thermoplasmata archaeon]